MMNASRFALAQTFDEFVESATEYQELWRMGAKRSEVPAGVVADLIKLAQPLHLVVLNEDWCLDAVSTVPPVVKLAEVVPELDVRILGRDANLDLMDAHLTGKGRSIPVVIVYDDEWNELGWWGPRPTPLQNWVNSVGATLPKEEKYHYVRTWYARDKGETTMRELADMILDCADPGAAEG
ncbi:MAG: thioredoxin family protein [Gemmatimonadaceae bacterium]